MADPTLPNLIIAGVNKAGTTSLFAYLGQHPQIGHSAVKETCYFLPARYGRAVAPLEAYRKQFAHCRDMPVRMESTPGYFCGGEEVARTIDQTLAGDVKILLMFREPVSRLISFYRFKKSTLELPADLSLVEYVARCRAMSLSEVALQENNAWFGLEGGHYDAYLQPWVERFGGRLKVLFFDDLKADARGVLRDVFDFVGVDASFADRAHVTVENRTTNFRNRRLQGMALALNNAGETFWRRHPALKQRLRDAYYRVNGRTFEREADEQTMAELRAHYAPHNARFAEQLRAAGVTTLPAWLHQEVTA